MAITFPSSTEPNIVDKGDTFLNDITSWIPDSTNLPVKKAEKLTVRNYERPSRVSHLNTL
jgi:hypothetical protein